MPNENHTWNGSNLFMQISAKTTDDGLIDSRARVNLAGSVPELLSGLCVGVRRALEDMGASDELFVSAFLTQDQRTRCNIVTDVGAIERAMNSLKEGEDDD